MSIFGHILLLLLGGVIVYFIFKDEKQRFNNGKIGLYVKERKASCSEPDFIAKLKVSIFKSFIIRFAILGFLASMIYIYLYMANEGSVDSDRFRALDYLVMWISCSMIAMVDRADTAKWNRF